MNAMIPETKRARWPRRLLWFLVVLAALYTVAWFLGAYLLDQRLAQSDAPAVAACEGRDVVGFPLSMAVTCERYSFNDIAESGPVRLAAPFTDLGRARIELTAPMTLTPPDRTDGGVVDVTWTDLNAEGEVGLTTRDLEDVSLSARDLIIRPGPHDLTIAAFDGMVSQGAAFGGVAQDAMLRADATGVQARLPYGLSIAPADLKLRATLRDGMARLAAAQYRLPVVLAEGADIDLQQLSLVVPSGGRIVLTGPLTLAADGLLSGKVSVGVAQDESLAEFASTLGPQVQQVVAGIVQAVATVGQPTVIDGVSVRAVDVTIEDGDIRLGFIPLGKIPPLTF